MDFKVSITEVYINSELAASRANKSICWGFQKGQPVCVEKKIELKKIKWLKKTKSATHLTI